MYFYSLQKKCIYVHVHNVTYFEIVITHTHTHTHRGLFEIMESKSEEDLEQLADNFTTVKSHFGALHTVELEHGGENRKVTMANRHDFVQKLFTWHLTGMIPIRVLLSKIC